MIDLHTHILPHLDDGPATLEESIEMARSMVADGIAVAAATPHVRSDYPTTAERMELGVVEVTRALAEARVPLRLLTGGEIGIDRLPLLSDDDLRRFSLGGGRRHLLVETPYRGWPIELADSLLELRRRGFVPVLAHPERNPDVQRRPELLGPFVSGGLLVQLTAASLDGRLGRSSRRAAFALLERGLAHMVASDAHGPAVRSAGLSAAREAIGDQELWHRLVQAIPASILAPSPF